MAPPPAVPTRRSPLPARRTTPANAPFLADVLAGFGASPKSVPSRWFYDAHGSRLFQWISNLPDYYPTRVERGILEAHGEAIAARFAGVPCTVVDLGAGDGHKTLRLLDRLARRVPALSYAPVDVSREALDDAASRVREALPAAAVTPVRTTYVEALEQLGGEGRKLVLFLGSSIGNLEHAEALAFLRALRGALRAGDHALVGFDLVKPLPLLRRAYDDPQGVTRAFNLNLLARMNRELGADFDLAAFRHRATWDPGRPAMESWLESQRDQIVHVGGHAFGLETGERIHTEISCKYTDGAISAFAEEAGFAEVARFHDRRAWFADALWRVP